MTRDSRRTAKRSPSVDEVNILGKGAIQRRWISMSWRIAEVLLQHFLAIEALVAVVAIEARSMSW